MNIGRHKGYKENTVNTVNYMSSPFMDWVFLGFIRLSGPLDYWGMRFPDDESAYVAFHLNPNESSDLESDHEQQEEILIKNGMKSVGILYGSDNTSYILRFDSIKTAIKWFKETESVDIEMTSNALYYNS